MIRSKLIQSQVDPVIGQPVLRKVVGADAARLRSPEPIWLRRAVGPLTVQFLLLEFIDPAAEDAHGPVVVLVLLRSSWHLISICSGVSFLYHRRTADSVLLTCWPPAPAGAHCLPLDVRILDIDWTSSGSGSTATVAAEV